MDGHSSVTVIHWAERRPGRVVFNKWVMIFATTLKKSYFLLQGGKSTGTLKVSSP